MHLRRSHFAAVAVVSLVLLAGCGGFLGGGPDGTPTATETETEAVTETEMTPTDENGPAPGTEGLDGATLEESHTAALSDQSFTTSLSFELASERNGTERSVFVNRSVAIDRERQRARSVGELVQADGDSLTTTTYTADDETAEERVLRQDGETRTDYRSDTEPYDGEVQPVNESEVVDRGLLRAIGSDIDWTYVGTDTVEGETVSRFEASGVENVSGFSAGGAATDGDVGSNVSADANDTAEAVVLVDEDGVVRQFEYTLVTEQDGVPVRVSLSVDVTAIGETTVEEPSWLDEARS
jgi:hypothetical protein